MNSVILSTVSRLITGLLLMFSVFLLIRGHNLPGGGFVGGLVAGGAFVLQMLAEGPHSARRLLGIDPARLIAIGLIVAAASGIPSFFEGVPFLTGFWDKTVWPVLGKIGTPLIFDIGVYITVVGVACLIVISLGEEGEED
jgi:multicomponent Na+:H+ antiporter subunit B